MEGFVKGAFKLLMSITGVSKFLTLCHSNPWLGLFLLVSLALTVFWMIKLFPKPSATMGKTFGGVAIGLIKLAIGMGLALGIANMILHMGMSMISGALGRIPLIGTFLSNVANWLISAVAGLIVALMLGIYLIKNVGNLVRQAMGVVTGSVSDWKAGRNESSIDGVRTSYVIAACLIPAVIICHPNYNVDSLFVPALLSSLLGIFALIWATTTGKKLIDAPIGTRPRQSDGAWKCRNHSGQGDDGEPGQGKSNPMPILNMNGTPKRGLHGKLVRGRGFCPGPQGKDVDGHSYNGWNPKEARQCLSPFCDYPNPYWQICQKCGFAGKDGKGFPRLPNGPVRCPKCRHVHPALPETMPFHLQGKDIPEPKAVQPLPAPVLKCCPQCGYHFPPPAPPPTASDEPKDSDEPDAPEPEPEPKPES